MNQDFVLEITHQSLKVTALLGAPMLLGALIIGVLISLFQAVTQINEQTLSLIPKILVIGVTLVIFAPWMMETMSSFTRDLIINIPSIVAVR